MADEDEDEINEEEDGAQEDAEGGAAGSDDPFADDDLDDFDFADTDEDDGDEDGDGDADDDDDDDFDFPMPGDDDDEFEDLPDLDDIIPARGRRGQKSNPLAALKDKVSGGTIALAGVGGVFLLIVISVVTWLSLSFDEDAYDKANEKVEVVTSIAGLASPEPTKAGSKKKPEPKPKKAKDKAAAKPVKSDQDKTAAAKPKDDGGFASQTKKKTAEDKKDPGDAKPGEVKPGEVKSADKKPGEENSPAAADGKTEPAKPGEIVLAKVDPALFDETPNGPLPVIAPDGRQAWQVYARPFRPAEDEKKSGKVALVMAGLGLSKTQTLAAIQQLPGEVTLSFAPYARNLGDWIAQARAAGHEVILEVPMEPDNYPDSDPGPHTLLTGKGPSDNIDSLNWLLTRFPGYVGITNFLGAKFTANEEAMTPILQYLKKRGLMYLDSRSSRKSVGARLAKEFKMPRAYNTRFIDKEASRVSIDARLFELERIAKSTGAAVGIGFPFPVTLERLKTWMADAKKKKIVLVPLSAVANLQTIR
jgi:uncharacterized protein